MWGDLKKKSTEDDLSKGHDPNEQASKNSVRKYSDMFVLYLATFFVSFSFCEIDDFNLEVSIGVRARLFLFCPSVLCHNVVFLDLPLCRHHPLLSSNHYYERTQ